MKSLVYAVKSDTRAQLVEKTIECGDYIKKYQDAAIRTANSLTERAQRCLDNYGGHFEAKV